MMYLPYVQHVWSLLLIVFQDTEFGLLLLNLLLMNDTRSCLAGGLVLESIRVVTDVRINGTVL